MTLDRIKLRQLIYLIEVARHHSFLRTAQALRVTQPAVTRTIRELEETLGVRLFDRSHNGVKPTLFGSVLLQHATIALAELRAGIGDIEGLRQGLGGQVTVGGLPAALALLLPRAITRLKAGAPDVAVSVTEGRNDVLLPALRAGDLDFIVGRPANLDQMVGLSHETLYYERLSIFVRKGHPAARDGAPRMIDLLACTWVVPQIGTAIRDSAHGLLREAGLSFPVAVIEATSPLLVRNMVQEAEIVGVAPYSVALPDLQSGAAIEVVDDLKGSFGSIGITLRTDNDLAPAANRLLRHVRVVAGMVRRNSGTGVVAEV